MDMDRTCDFQARETSVCGAPNPRNPWRRRFSAL